MTTRNRALLVVALAVVLDVLAAFAFSTVEHIGIGTSFYWAITTATTVGYGDVTPHTQLGHVIASVVMLTIIPLISATFSLVTSGLTSTHIWKHNESMRGRLEHIIRHHPDIPPYEPPPITGSEPRG